MEGGTLDMDALASASGTAERGAPPWPAWKPRLWQPGGLHIEGGRRLGPSAPVVAPRQGPLVSYITVVKNAAPTLARTLRSVATQTWPHVEHIVLDGASTDGTLEIIAEHAAALDYYASAPDTGLYDALNKAIELATGELICVLNADDWLTPDAAALAARAHASKPGMGARLLLSAAWWMDGDRKSIWLPTRLTPAVVLTCANVCHNAVYATRAAYEATGPYRTDLRVAADFAWLVQCQRARVAFEYLDLPTIHYSMGGLSSDTLRHTQDCVQVLRHHVPALSDAEAWGLVHCFHTFDSNLLACAKTKPVHHGRFLLDLAHRHADDPYLMQALALASAARMTHPADTTPGSKLTRREKLSRSLQKRGLALRALWRGLQ